VETLIDMTSLLPIELQLRGWVLEIDAAENAHLSHPYIATFYPRDLAQGVSSAYHAQAAFDRVMPLLAPFDRPGGASGYGRGQGWRIRRNNLRNRAEHRTYGSTAYTTSWPQLFSWMAALMDGSIKPYKTRARPTSRWY
jgi:hypothetical protein